MCLAGAACGRAPAPLPRETAAVVRDDIVPLLEKPGPETKVRGLANVGDVFTRSIEQAPDLTVLADANDGYGPYRGLFVGLRRERSGPLWLGPASALDDASVVTTDALCAALRSSRGATGVSPDCAHDLRRLALPDGATLGYLPCLAGPCPVIHAPPTSARAAPTISIVDGLTDIRGLRTAGGFRLVLTQSATRPGQGPATRYELREPNAGLRVLLVVAGSETDVTPTGGTVTRLLRVHFGRDEAHVVGSERRADHPAAVGSSQTIDERIRYPR